MPTDVLDRPAWRFWMDAKIRAAGVAWENDAAQEVQNGSSTGAATQSQKSQMVRDNEARADRKDRQDGSAPPLEDQMAALEGDG